MHEHLKALMFYRILKQALESPGIAKILVTMTEDGELEANVVID